MMLNDIPSFILQYLNNEPFNLNLSSLQFDQMQPQQLLQTLSNVLSWISESENIDIKREAAEDTAIRVLNMLRILRYRPPEDPEEQEEWRAGIVEGQKASLYPLLVFLFENSESLKERAYLAKYLIKTEVPGDVQDYDTAELQNDLAEYMAEFKEIHAELKAIMTDVYLLDDIKDDLKSMEKEKQILARKIEKTEKKVQNIPYFEKQMQMAAQLRGEKTRYADYAIEKQRERQQVLQLESIINGMKIKLSEAQDVANTLDEQALMEKLEDEVATNTYLANEKLAVDLLTRQNKLKEMGAMIRSSSVKDEDIKRMNEEIEEMTKRIRKLEDERDHKEVDIDENMSVFRHQVSLLERKKETAVQKLQQLRQELNKVDKEVEERKNNLKEKVGGEVVSNVQYRKYLEQYRQKSEEQRKKRKEMDFMHSEKGVLKRTVDILVQRYSKLETHIESIGGEIVEVLNVPQKFDRPKTAAPQTNNTEDIKIEMKQMMSTLDERKDRITDQRAKRDKMKAAMMKNSEKLAEMKTEMEERMNEMEQINRITVERVKDLELTIQESREKIPELKAELADLLDDKNSLQGSGGSNIEQQLKEAEEREKHIDEQINELGDVEEKIKQAGYWKDLQILFSAKLDIFKEKENSRN
uniref:Intraflagellar transport protein 81 homolog n=1 Tax=Caenorhabditis japonica TaxID=281687 RepID=A0A8R1DUV3_CAEJA